MSEKPKDYVSFLLCMLAFFVIGYIMGMGHGPDEVELTTDITDDLSIIRTAAEQNGIEYGSENWYILLAIRCAENGPPGREFGIMNPEANTFDLQARWCAASIVNARGRWIDAGKPGDFITFMGRRYCPPDDHPLNKNWVPNVKYLKKKLSDQSNLPK